MNHQEQGIRRLVLHESLQERTRQAGNYLFGLMFRRRLIQLGYDRASVRNRIKEDIWRAVAMSGRLTSDCTVSNVYLIECFDPESAPAAEGIYVRVMDAERMEWADCYDPTETELPNCLPSATYRYNLHTGGLERIEITEPARLREEARRARFESSLQVIDIESAYILFARAAFGNRGYSLMSFDTAIDEIIAELDDALAVYGWHATYYIELFPSQDREGGHVKVYCSKYMQDAACYAPHLNWRELLRETEEQSDAWNNRALERAAVLYDKENRPSAVFKLHFEDDRHVAVERVDIGEPERLKMTALGKSI